MRRSQTTVLTLILWMIVGGANSSSLFLKNKPSVDERSAESWEPLIREGRAVIWKTRTSNSSHVKPNQYHIKPLPKRQLKHHDTIEKRDEKELPAATDDQIKEMCTTAGCKIDGKSAEIIITKVQTISDMLQYLKTNSCIMKGRRLKFKRLDSPLLSITRTGANPEDFRLDFGGNVEVALNDDYRKFVTFSTISLAFEELYSLQQVNDGFFEYFFPNLENLIIKKGEAQPSRHSIPKLHVGFLPKLIMLDVEYAIDGDIAGCKLPLGEEACFAEGISITLKLDSVDEDDEVGLVDFHLPSNVGQLYFKAKPFVKHTDAFEGKTISVVRIEITSFDEVASLSFFRTNVRARFYFISGRPDEKSDLITNFDSMLHNPSIAWKWQWRIDEKSKEEKEQETVVRVPVVFGTSLEQQFDDLQGDELEKSTCKFSHDILADSNTIDGRVLKVRRLYVDMTHLIEANSKNKGTFDEIHVTAFHVHVSKSLDIDFRIRVSYIKITTDGDASIGHLYTGSFFRSKRSSAVELKLREHVDALFMQAFKVCTAKLIAQERNLGVIDTSEKSVGNRIGLYQLPAELTGTPDEIFKAEKVMVKVGEFLEYLRETATEKAMRVPYLSLQYQEENMGILLNMAESITAEKRHNKLVSQVVSAQVDVMNEQDKSTLALLHTEYKRTVSLVLISTRKAHDIGKKLKATINLVTEADVKFQGFQKEMEAANKTFQAGVVRAKAFAYAEVASAVTSSILSFFSGGFDPGKVLRAAKKVKELLQKLKKIKKLAEIFKKLSKLVSTLRNIAKLSRKATKSMKGRVGRLFQRMKNFKIKQNSFLKKMMEKCKTFAASAPANIKAKWESYKVRFKRIIDKNQEKINKFKRLSSEVINDGLDSIEGLNSVMESIVDSKKAKVTLDNAFTTGSVQNVHNKKIENEEITEKDIEEALKDEFALAVGERKEQRDEFAKIYKEYELSGSKSVIQEGEKLNAVDVLEWDAANANIEGTMDASISMDIPETTTFKAALMKMNLAGKLKTEAMIDEAAIRVDLDRARFETTTYYRKGSHILKQIKDIEDKLKKRRASGADVDASGSNLQSDKKHQDYLLQLGWKEFHVKLNILISSMSYCSAYYYFHLNPCPPDHTFDFDTSLEDIVHQQREMQRQALLRLEDFYPAPQTMLERTLIFEKPNGTCTCMAEVQQKKNFETLYSDLMKCNNGEIKSNNVNEDETKRLLEALSRGCEVNEVRDMREFKIMKFKVGVDSTLAEGHSRVRIDEMKVFFYGAKTRDGIIKVSIESSGVSLDRYKGKVYHFYGDKWQRDFSYYARESKIDSRKDNAGGSDEITKPRVLDAADVYRSFRGIYRTSTMFTTWIIKIDPARNPGLDLSDLEKIEIKFSGSFVASAHYRAAEDEDDEDKSDDDEIVETGDDLKHGTGEEEEDDDDTEVDKE